MKIFWINMFFAALLFAAIGCKEKTPANVDSSSPVSEVNAESQPATQSGEPAAISFEKTEYDFGAVEEGEMVVYSFAFTNSGNVPLVIQSATSSCGCTVPEPPKDPIPPGESGKIEVKFNTTGRPNQQNKTITIMANTEPQRTLLKIKGTVLPKDQAMGPVRRN